MEPSPPCFSCDTFANPLIIEHFPQRALCREPAIYCARNTLLPGWLSTGHRVHLVIDSWSCALCGQTFIPEVLTLFLHSRTNPLRASLLLSIVPQTVDCLLLCSQKDEGLPHNMSRCKTRVVKAQFPKGEGCTVA